MILSVLATTVLLAAPPAHAQDCYVTSLRSDVSTTGKPRISARTELSGSTCSNFATQSEGWIQTMTITCDLGTQSGEACYNFASWQTAPFSRVIAAYTGTAYGGWTAWGKHWYIVDSNWMLHDENWRTIHAGTAPSGGGSCDPDTGPCECDPVVEACQAPGSPILIPLTRSQDCKLTNKANGVFFDLDANGTPEKMAWTAADSRLAFLAIDRNGNGQIDDGSELFGDYTLPEVGNGFEALQQMNRALKAPGAEVVGSISEDEPLFAALLLWEDVNHDGISQPHELQPASSVVSDIGVGYIVSPRRDAHGNRFRYRGWAAVRTAPGRNQARTIKDQDARTIHVYDVFFVR